MTILNNSSVLFCSLVCEIHTIYYKSFATYNISVAHHLFHWIVCPFYLSHSFVQPHNRRSSCLFVGKNVRAIVCFQIERKTNSILFFAKNSHVIQMLITFVEWSMCFFSTFSVLAI